ncbi:MAG: CHAD domain-containing protein [Pseudomonadota bacterium]
MSTTELEVKLEIGSEGARRLPGKTALRAMRLGQPAQKILQSTYYDTPAHRLRDEAASLRVRWDGKDWVQTLKYGTKVEHGLSNPVEFECVLDGPELQVERINDPAVEQWLSDILSEGPLAPVFETEIDRHTHLLRCKDIGTVELAIDRGEVKDPRRSTAINEVELELKSGLPFALLTIAEQLFDGERISAATASKAERGYALSRQPSRDLDAPKAHSKPDLQPDQAAANAFKAIGRSAAGQVLNNLNLLKYSDDPEVPHQLRVGLRRLRACMRVFRSFLTSDELRRLAHDARDLGRVVGNLRDADVLLIDIAVPAVEALGNKGKHQATLDYLAGNQADQRRLVRESTASERWTFLKLNCMLFEQAVDRAFLNAEKPPADETVMSVARRELERTWQHVLKKGRGFADHAIEERHEMRKMLKTMRYASEYFLQLYPGEKTEAFTADLKRLQNAFGYLNDLAMAEALQQKITVKKPDDTRLRRSVATILGWHQERAEKAMRKADQRWHSLCEGREFWRIKTVSG